MSAPLDTSEALANTREARAGIAQQAWRRSVPVAPADLLLMCDRMIGWIERVAELEAALAAAKGEALDGSRPTA